MALISYTQPSAFAPLLLIGLAIADLLAGWTWGSKD